MTTTTIRVFPSPRDFIENLVDDRGDVNLSAGQVWAARNQGTNAIFARLVAWRMNFAEKRSAERRRSDTEAVG